MVTFNKPSSEIVIDRKKFKTPFFKVGIGLPGAPPSSIKDLPIHIHKLIEKVEINEVLESGCAHMFVKLYMIEGSMEPHERSSATKATLYEGGSFSNSSGFVSDLKTIESGGGVGLSSLPSIGTATVAVPKIGGTTPSEVETSNDGELQDDKAPVFLFSPSARLKITWGYVEDEENWRTILTDILVVRSSFPDGDMPSTEIVSKGPTYALDNLTPKKGKVFSISVDRDNKDMTIDELLDLIEKDAKVEVIRSDKYDAELEDPGKIKKWAAGVSLHQYLTQLATKHNVYYNAYYSATTGVATITFINRDEMDSAVSLTESVMTYKGPNSILKSVNVTADFGKLVSKSHTGINNSSGKNIRGDSNQAEKKTSVSLHEGETAIDTDMASGRNSSKAAVGVKNLAGGAASQVIYNPTSRLRHLQAQASNGAYPCKKAVTLDFTTLGYTRIRPGPLPFRGLGVRFSGVYTVIGVTHTIDNTGYTCRGNASGSSLGIGGVEIPPKGEKKHKGSVSVQQFHSLIEGKE